MRRSIFPQFLTAAQREKIWRIVSLIRNLQDYIILLRKSYQSYEKDEWNYEVLLEVLPREVQYSWPYCSQSTMSMLGRLVPALLQPGFISPLVQK